MERTRTENLSRIGFSLMLLFALMIASLYLYNMGKWSSKPDYGFAFRSATGIHSIGVVTKTGHQAGLKLGDRFLKVNGKTYNTIRELRSYLKEIPGEKNQYLVERSGKQFEVNITNIPIGWTGVFVKSGLTYILGLIYVLIGCVVFLMLPHRKMSWVFFLVTSTFGLLLMFLFKVSALRPAWLGTVHIFLYTFAPATFIHLAFTFPEERNFVRKQPNTQFIPYVISAMIFLFIRMTSSEMTGVPKLQFILLAVYLLASVLYFLVSTLHHWIRSASVMAKARARIILLGFGISASIPVADILTNALFRTYLVPGFNYYLPFFLAFPLCIAYSILKHSLFAIEAAIRRTFGYTLNTAVIVLANILVIIVLSRLLGSFVQYNSIQFLIALVILNVLFFQFIRKRVQKTIDRVFYRQEFNFQETVEKISQSMRSLLNINQIESHIMDIAENILFSEKSSVLLWNREKDGDSTFPFAEPLVKKIVQHNREITRYDIEDNPLFSLERQAFKDAFIRLKAALIMPLVYENRLQGIIGLGKKKSGKFYSYADVHLLRTLANQGAVAIENARLIMELEEQTDAMKKTNLELEQEIKQRQRAEAQLDNYRQQLEEKVEKQKVELKQNRKAMADLKRDLDKGQRFRNMIGKSESMLEVYALIKDLADVSATVLVRGESGTGKELVAEALHAGSRRRNRSFVKVNCSALSESVLESELFGHVKGAFTGADRDKVGRFQKASNGTILLDEIGDVSTHFQKRLLRVLQEHEFERLGDSATIRMNARVLAATNQDLLKKVKAGEFRQDLYYRLKVVEIVLPPLRERKEDIPLLIHHFLDIFNRELRKNIKGVSPELLRILMNYPWPGNVRELRNILENISILCKGQEMTVEDLPADFPDSTAASMELSGTPSTDDGSFEFSTDGKAAVLKALEKAQWNKTRAAQLLNISRRTLYRKLKEYEID